MTKQNNDEEIVTAIYGKRDGAFTVDMGKVKRVSALINKRIVEELEMLEHIDWESYHGEKVEYDSGINELVDMYVGAYAKDRIQALTKPNKDTENVG